MNLKEIFYCPTLRIPIDSEEPRAISEEALAQSEKGNADLEVESVFENFEDIRDKLKTLVRELS